MCPSQRASHVRSSATLEVREFRYQYASIKRKNGGEFSIPRCVSRLFIEMLEPFEGRVYNPGCGFGGVRSSRRSS